MALKTVTFRSPEEKIASLDTIASLQQRDRSFVINEAVDHYLSLHDYHRELIEEGLRQCEAGDSVEHEEVLEMVRSGKMRERAGSMVS